MPALEGDTSAMNDMVISEFAADGSTGPSRMVRKGPWKLMWLEGVDSLLYNIEDDPNETDNRIDDPELVDLIEELSGILFNGWDPEQLRVTIRASQERRLAIHNITGGEPSYVNIIRTDDNERYIRNAGAADTKAKARLPFVPSATPDS